MILAPGRLELETVDSTQRIASEAARTGNPIGVVWALEQTAGRGRHNREWISQPGASLTVSLTVTELPEKLWLLGMAAGFAVAEAFDLGLQWPNDLVINRKKVGGILTTIIGSCGVIGLGLNLAQSPFPEQNWATGLAAEGWSEMSPRDALERAAAAIQGFPLPTSWQDLHEIWDVRDQTSGKLYTTPQGKVVEAQFVDEEGRLVGMLRNGESVTLTAASALFGESQDSR